MGLCSLCVNMLTVTNSLLMSSATVMVRSGGLFWLKPVAMVLFMLCSAVLVEWLLLKQCCVKILFMIYGSSVFFLLSLREVSRYDVHMFMSLFGFGIRMFALVSMSEG